MRAGSSIQNCVVAVLCFRSAGITLTDHRSEPAPRLALRQPQAPSNESLLAERTSAPVIQLDSHLDRESLWDPWDVNIPWLSWQLEDNLLEVMNDSHLVRLRANSKLDAIEQSRHEAIRQREASRGMLFRDRLAQLSPLLVVLAMATFKASTTMSRGAHELSAADFRWAMECVAALSLYLTTGPAVILLNKHIMKHYHFHFPTLLASLGTFFLLIVTRVAAALGIRNPQRDTMDWRKYRSVVLPISVFNFAAQVLGMYPFLFISVPHIQIMKSFTIVWTLGFACLLANERINGPLVVSICFIVIGCVVSTVGAAGASLTGHNTSIGAATIGSLLMLGGSTFEGLKTVYSQIMMAKLSLFDGMYWASPSFVVLAIIFIACTELHGLIQFDWSWPLGLALLGNALLTGAIVMSTFWFVKLADAVTAKVVVQARSVGLVLFAVLFTGETCSTQQYCGYTVTLVGVCLFDFAKQRLQKSGQSGKETAKS